MRGLNLLPLDDVPSGGDEIQLIIDRFDGLETRHFENGLRLSAYMLWPNDEKRRNQWMLSGEDIRRCISGEDVGVDPGLAPFGGLRAVIEMASTKIDEEAARIERGHWLRVAELYQAVVTIAYDPRTQEIPGGASIEKAKKMLELERTAASASAYEKSWQRYHDAAHLITAAHELSLRVKRRLPEDRQSITPLSVPFFAPEVLLSAALAYQEFGLTYFPHARNRPLLNPDDLWRIPDELAIEPTPLHGRPLPEEMVEFLTEEYRTRSPS